MTETDPVCCAGLHYSYGGFEAVRGVDLTVRRGELFALLGTNGAGKTSTLEVLRGHRRPGAGLVRVLGLDPSRSRRQLAPRVGVVPQDSGFAAALTVAETLRLWGRLAGHDPSVSRMTAMLRETHLEHRARVAVRQLSGGERRRLDLAVALLGDPPLLLLDEPTTGLDPQAREHTWTAIRRRLRQGVTVLLTTHYLEEAEALADRLAIMDGGRIVVAGTPAEVTAARPARIRCLLPGRLRRLPPPAIAGDLTWTPQRDGTVELLVTTGSLHADLSRITTWVAGHGAEPARLNAAPAALADVFHHLTADGPGQGGDRR